MFDLGATRYLGDGWRISGGYMYSDELGAGRQFQSARARFGPAHFQPWRGKEVRQFQLGCGLSIGLGTVPLRWQRRHGRWRTNGNYEFFSHALTINFGYHF